MNLMFPENHSKGAVELTVRQKKDIDNELTTKGAGSQIASKSKVKQKKNSYFLKEKDAIIFFKEKSFPADIFSNSQLVLLTSSI